MNKRIKITQERITEAKNVIDNLKKDLRQVQHEISKLEFYEKPSSRGKSANEMKQISQTLLELSTQLEILLETSCEFVKSSEKLIQVDKKIATDLEKRK